MLMWLFWDARIGKNSNVKRATATSNDAVVVLMVINTEYYHRACFLVGAN